MKPPSFEEFNNWFKELKEALEEYAYACEPDGYDEFSNGSGYGKIDLANEILEKFFNEKESSTE